MLKRDPELIFDFNLTPPPSKIIKQRLRKIKGNTGQKGGPSKTAVSLKRQNLLLQRSSNSHGSINNAIGGSNHVPNVSVSSRKQTYSSSERGSNDGAAGNSLYGLPDEVLLKIFSNLLEEDLCHVAQVCKRFNKISNDKCLWKHLYHDLFEYDLPMFPSLSTRFDFAQVEECKYENPWKESFKQLYRGIHVRPGYRDRDDNDEFEGRNVLFFDDVTTAYKQCKHIENIWIFIHAGVYKGEILIIDTNVKFIGAAPGNVMEKVILEQNTDSIVVLKIGSKEAYLGYLTLKFIPRADSLDVYRPFKFDVDEEIVRTYQRCMITGCSQTWIQRFFYLLPR